MKNTRITKRTCAICDGADVGTNRIFDFPELLRALGYSDKYAHSYCLMVEQQKAKQHLLKTGEQRV